MISVKFYSISIILLLYCIGKTVNTSSAGKKPAKPGAELSPYIDLTGSPDVNVSLGRSATLKCKTVNLIKKSAQLRPIYDLLVSWLRHKDVKLLSVGTYLYTTDPRMMVRQDLSAGEWQLVIKDVRFSDAGQYECQINTSPVLSHTLKLAVVEPYTKILLDTAPETPGSPATLYIDIRSVLNLTCAVYSPEVPAAIFWKHNGKLLDLGQEYSGDIQTVAGRAGSPTLSYLSLVLTRTNQSGVYECSPSNTGQDQVTVHIVQDKELPVGQSQSQSERGIHNQQTVLDRQTSSQSNTGTTIIHLKMTISIIAVVLTISSRTLDFCIT